MLLGTTRDKEKIRKIVEQAPEGSSFSVTSNNRSRWDNFMAGIAGMFIAIVVMSVLTSIGDYSDASTFTWTDALWVIFMMAVFASTVIDLYKFFRDIK